MKIFLVVRLFIFTVVLITIPFINAVSQVAIDVKGGLNTSTFSNFSGQPALHEYILQPAAGVIFRTSLSSKWELCPELLLNGEGFRSPSPFYSKYSLYYLDIPVNIRYYVHLNDETKLFLSAGIFGGMRTFSKYTQQSPGLMFNNSASNYTFSITAPTAKIITINDDRRLDAGFSAGVGLRISKATIGLNFSRGIVACYSNSNNYNQYLSLYFAW